MKDFLKTSDGCHRLQAYAVPGMKELVEFKLEQETYTLISVFLVQDSKTPLQGAYVPEEDFAHGMRKLSLRDLVSNHPCVQVAPMDDVRAWIAKSE